MNNKYRIFTVNLILTILVFAAMSVSAQVMRKKNAPIQQTPVPAYETSVSPGVKNLSSVSGTIRWSKKFGLPPTGPATGEASPLPCGLMYVVVMKNLGEPGSFGRQEQIATSWDQVKMSKELKAEEDGNYYVCPYSISGLPRNVNLTISGRFNSPEYENIQWIGSWVQPPAPDYMRIFKGTQSVTLTDAQPNAVVNFTISLAPVPSMPR
jgi:hypothetical protein